MHKIKRISQKEQRKIYLKGCSNKLQDQVLEVFWVDLVRESTIYVDFLTASTPMTITRSSTAHIQLSHYAQKIGALSPDKLPVFNTKFREHMGDRLAAQSHRCSTGYELLRWALLPQANFQCNAKLLTKSI